MRVSTQMALIQSNTIPEDPTPHIPHIPLPALPHPFPLPANSQKARQHPPFQIHGISQHPSTHTPYEAYPSSYNLSTIYIHAGLFSYSLSRRFSLFTPFRTNRYRNHPSNDPFPFRHSPLLR